MVGINLAAVMISARWPQRWPGPGTIRRRAHKGTMHQVDIGKKLEKIGEDQLCGILDGLISMIAEAVAKRIKTA